MRTCSYCGAQYPEDVSRCPIDNAPLIEASVSPTPPERGWEIVKQMVSVLSFKRLKFILATLMVAAVIAVPLSIWERHHKAAEAEATAAQTCIDNLFEIDYAKRCWARDYIKDSNATPTWDDIAPKMSVGWGADGAFNPPKCPSGGTYTIGRIGERPACSCPKHTMPLIRLTVHAGDAALDEGAPGGADEKYFDSAKKEFEMRPAGSIVGATVKVLDETGHYTKKNTDLEGTAIVNTWPNKPVAVIVSKRGFLTVSNSVSTNALLDWGAVSVVLQKESK